jgi:hypothetical protein
MLGIQADIFIKLNICCPDGSTQIPRRSKALHFEFALPDGE